MSISNKEVNDGESLITEAINKEGPSTSNTVRSKSATTPEIPDFGWSAYAERMNGRFAMIGLSAVLIIELTTNKAFLEWSGLIQ